VEKRGDEFLRFRDEWSARLGRVGLALVGKSSAERANAVGEELRHGPRFESLVHTFPADTREVPCHVDEEELEEA
jgi:hypothetical protein